MSCWALSLCVVCQGRSGAGAVEEGGASPEERVSGAPGPLPQDSRPASRDLVLWEALRGSPRELGQPACDSLGRNAALLTLPRPARPGQTGLFVNEMRLGTRFQQLAWKLESSLGLLGWGTGKPGRLT